MNIIDIARECGGWWGEGGFCFEDQSCLTALESRIRADEREKLAALVAAKIMRVTSANSHRGKMTSVGSFAVGILEDLDAAIRNSDAAPVAE